MVRAVMYATVLMMTVMLLLVSGGNRGAAAEEDAEAFPDFLFVQTASGATLNGTLVLTGVSADTTYFADRPDRIAGSLLTEDFLRLFRDAGDDDFGDVRSFFPSLSLCVPLRSRLEWSLRELHTLSWNVFSS